ncbi:hypothetical protein GCM10027262_76820 [Nocardia tengchongensis]
MRISDVVAEGPRIWADGCAPRVRWPDVVLIEPTAGQAAGYRQPVRCAWPLPAWVSCSMEPGSTRL